jgi:hypothetical protein
MTAWFERRPGSEETLLALYDAVGVAEELDLAEQARDEAFWAEVSVLYDWPSEEADEPDDVAAALDGDDMDDADRLTISQAVGIIEHLLGGRPMHSGGQPAR